MHKKKPKAGQPNAGAGGKRGPKSKLTPELIRHTAELSKRGNNNKEIAAALGIQPQTVCEYQKKNPEFAEALKKGRSFAVAMVEGSLYKSARGYELVRRRRKYIRVIEGPEGKQRARRVLAEEIEEPVHIAPNPTSIALFLNNNAPERYTRKPEDQAAKPAVVIFQFNVVETDGTKKQVTWDPTQPPPTHLLAS